MSASLVGSEMCIRDRDKTGRPRLLIVARWWRFPPGRGDFAHGSPTRPPVSYTHLTLPTICSV
eukprot:13816814-Alexandrium_andersonii.AAC.1